VNPFQVGPPPPPLHAGDRQATLDYICNKDMRKSPHKVAALLDNLKQIYQDTKTIGHITIRIKAKICIIHFDGKAYVIQNFYG
jgi:hypothetical protein